MRLFGGARIGSAEERRGLAYTASGFPRLRPSTGFPTSPRVWPKAVNTTPPPQIRCLRAAKGAEARCAPTIRLCRFQIAGPLADFRMTTAGQTGKSPAHRRSSAPAYKRGNSRRQADRARQARPRKAQSFACRLHEVMTSPWPSIQPLSLAEGLEYGLDAAACETVCPCPQDPHKPARPIVIDGHRTRLASLVIGPMIRVFGGSVKGGLRLQAAAHPGRTLQPSE